MKTDATVAAPPPGRPAEPENPEPNPARSRRVTMLVLGFIVVMGSLWAIGPIVFANRDDPTAIDHKAVRATVLASCTQLRADLAALPAGGAPADRAEAENRTVEQFVARIRALGPDALADDAPVERWLGDWEQIVAARRRAVQAGERFAPPVTGGAPINVRMYALIRSGLGACDVPPVLLASEPGRV